MPYSSQAFSPKQAMPIPEKNFKEQLQEDLIAFCCGTSPQIPEDLIDALCQAVVDWEPQQ